jgi:hypothetical protein
LVRAAINSRSCCATGGVASIKAHPEEESKNEKRQNSAGYCVKKSLFSKHYVSPACAGIEFQDRLGFLSFTPRGTPGVWAIDHFKNPFFFSQSATIL